jgi:cytochrome c oxidase subunit I+III
VTASDNSAGGADAALPNPSPRPEGELEALQAVWRRPRGWRFLTVVNNTYIGILYVGVSLLFFVLAGVLALIMRTQLAQPELELVSHKLYNQLFTMHGTVMMFLFAVPAVEALSVYLLPNMLGARDLPFPRLGAYAFWAYAIGGLAFFCTIFFGVSPDGGWFMYPPLTSLKFSPGVNVDFWLLGIGFIEISAIAGAIEIIIGVLRTRSPGMTLDKLPIYAWAMLIFAVMIIVGFPAIILGTLLLEVERALDWPFFIPERGGDPILWQHLFWFFGHPEVYVIFLPAAGLVSMMVPALAQTPLQGYRLVVLALIATGFLSFGLWVHHMFATGLPKLSLAFFSAASTAVAVPSGIQVFAWIATIARGRIRLNTPTLFILGFLFVFTMGGLTGVMVAVAPFDWQAHDTYFVVAHLHYVLIGGMVFPFFAALYFWIPVASKRPLSEAWGRWVFGLMFTGMHVTFLPMHLTGMIGMPRRVYTYPADLGWNWLNLASTIGAYLIAAGVLVFIVDMIRNFRPTKSDNAGNVWNAGTLEWLPNDSYGTRSVPHVTSREPLWDQPDLARQVEEGRHYLPGTATGGRETIITSALGARPQFVLLLPGPSWLPFLAAAFTAAFFLLLTVKFIMTAAICGVLAVVCMIVWLWETDAGPVHPPVAIGGGIEIPVVMQGPQSHSWWATVITLIVAGMIYACLVFSYFFLWTVNPTTWLPGDLPSLLSPALSGVLYVLASAMLATAGYRLSRPGAERDRWIPVLLVASLVPGVAGLAFDVAAQLAAGVDPKASSYGATVFALAGYQGIFLAISALMVLYTAARWLAGYLTPLRRATYDNTMLFFHYTMAQGVTTLVITHFFPRLVGAGA